MFPWERRLRDLGELLVNCEGAYFEPDLYRRNTNQFLQTARTVTFIIQKNKDSIPEFDVWYKANVRDAWVDDHVMTWAKDARNTIEKEGDLDLHSSLTLALIYSYLTDEDVSVPCGRNELVRAGVKMLTRFARRVLPSALSDVALVKIERRWVANSLPEWGLHTALIYVYARLHVACSALANHMGHQLDESIRSSRNFDQAVTDGKKTRYAKLNSLKLAHLTAQSISVDPSRVSIPEKFRNAVEKRKDDPVTNDLHRIVERHSELAEATFDHYGYHMHMLFIFDDQGRQIDFLGAHFNDQADKYIFWRAVGERILYLRGAAVVWVSEAWMRNVRENPAALMRNMPIVGEQLHVVGADRHGKFAEAAWEIVHGAGAPKPTLKRTEAVAMLRDWNFLAPVRSAFAQLWGKPDDA